jgi:hypothetical protein
LKHATNHIQQRWRALEKDELRMREIGSLIIVFGLILCSCNQSPQSATVAESKIDTTTAVVNTSTIENQEDKTEIQSLIREVLKWTDSKKSINLLPTIADSNDSIYIGFDIDQLNQNLIQLKKTDFFSKAFIDNYNQIVLTLDRKLKANEFEYGPWLVGDMPPFNFASDVNPWCLCQDNMDWNLVEIQHTIDNEYRWTWGGLNQDTHQSWEDFSYKFRVTKEESNWKISYLEGFNINEIKK